MLGDPPGSNRTNELRCVRFVSGRSSGHGTELRIARNKSHFRGPVCLHPFRGASASVRTLMVRNSIKQNLQTRHPRRRVTPLTTTGHVRDGVALRKILPPIWKHEWIASSIIGIIDRYRRYNEAREAVKGFPEKRMG